MSKSARLRVEDLRAIYHLAGECRDLGDDPFAWRRHLLAGVARLTGAASAITMDDGEGVWEPFHPDGVVVWGLENGFDPRAVARMFEAFARDGLSILPTFPLIRTALAQGLGPCLTRADLVPDALWYRSAFFRDYHGPTGGDAGLSCNLPLPGGSGETVVTLIRVRGERNFTPRDQAIVREAHIVVTAWIGGPLARFDEPSPAALPPRLRQVLRCLLEGDSDKQIAVRLRLSRYTVNEYVERIFRYFGVQSRPELLARWLRRGWGNRLTWAD